MNGNSADKKNIILEKFIEGTASPEEERIVYEWMNDPEKEQWMNAMLTRIWKDMGEAKPWSGSQPLLRKIHQENRMKKDSRLSRQMLYKVASGIAAIIFIPLLIYFFRQSGEQTVNFTNTGNSQETYVETRAPFSTRRQLKLSDGTIVWLNNGTILRYPDSFSGENRTVFLEGEAFFNVTPDKNHPFIIRTKGVDVKVTGTRLNVNAYPDDHFEEVSVESGTVELMDNETGKDESMVQLSKGQYAIYRNKDCRIDFDAYLNNNAERKHIVYADNTQEVKSSVSNMKTNDLIIFTKDGNKLVVRYDDPSSYSAWKEGKLVLRNDPMALMLNRIERWYNVRFVVTDSSIYHHTYWATFENENIEEILTLLNKTGPVRFEMTEGTGAGKDVKARKIIQVSLSKIK